MSRDIRRELAEAVVNTDPANDASIPPQVMTLLAEGRAVVEADRRAAEEAAEAEAREQRRTFEANARLAFDALVQMEPKVARLAPWLLPLEDNMAFQATAEFQEMRFKFELKGFYPVLVKVRRSWRHITAPTVGREWLPWEMEPFSVCLPNGPNAETAYPSLGVALAHAREKWLKDHKDAADIPF